MISAIFASMLVGTTYGAPVKLCTVRDKSVDESSGLGASPTQRGVFYTHNDSGDKPRFFRLNTKGEVTATFDLEGAKALDWEDMEVAKVGGKAWIYLADVGDNAEKRESITIYRIAEPTGAGRKLTIFDTYTLTYPDRAHNCEAFMVDPKSGDFWIVTKTSKADASVFWLKAPRQPGEFKLTKVGTVAIKTAISAGRLVTGGSISPDGKWVVLRTYLSAYEYSAAAGLKSWFKSAPERITMPFDPQGEAICYSADGKSLITTSEGSPFDMFTVTVNR